MLPSTRLTRAMLAHWGKGIAAAGIGLTAAIAASAQGGGTTSGFVDTELDFCAMHITFADEFEALSVSAHDNRMAKWSAHTPWNGDFGDAAFTDPGPGSPFAVADSVLSITASKDANGKWKSGLISSVDSRQNGFSQMYGYFEARMKLPRGAGLWPAFWLGTNEPRDRKEQSLEVDVIEHYGHAPTSYTSSLHIWSKDPPKSDHSYTKKAVADGFLYDDFRTFGVKVTPQTITYYLDREPYWQIATPPVHKMPLFPMVNLALGSGFPIDKTPDPSVLLVDYVKVFDFNREGAASSCPQEGTN